VSTKYNVSRTRTHVLMDGETIMLEPWGVDDVALTGHASGRYQERTPADACRPTVAWRRGETIRDPQVVRSDVRMTTPTRARVYNPRGERWTVVFLCDSDGKIGEYVTTVMSASEYDSDPPKAYLRAVGPHPGGDSA
jgi:hypothetical protein